MLGVVVPMDTPPPSEGEGPISKQHAGPALARTHDGELVLLHLGLAALPLVHGHIVDSHQHLGRRVALGQLLGGAAPCRGSAVIADAQSLAWAPPALWGTGG